MKAHAFALIAIAGLAFTAPAYGQQAATAAAPVTINSCTPELDNSTNAPSIAGIPIASSSMGIQIEFVNDSSKTADLINFDVDSNGTQFVIRDVGTFSPGISIKHKYRNGAGQAFVLPQFIAPKITCDVASVRFTDGTVWTKGQAQTSAAQPAAPQAASKLSANPARIEMDRSTESMLLLVSSTDRVTAFKESDNCAGVASVFVAVTAESEATYLVKPLGAGSCMAQITDEAGNTLSVPVIVH